MVLWTSFWNVVAKANPRGFLRRLSGQHEVCATHALIVLLGCSRDCSEIDVLTSILYDFMSSKAIGFLASSLVSKGISCWWCAADVNVQLA